MSAHTTFKKLLHRCLEEYRIPAVPNYRTQKPVGPLGKVPTMDFMVPVRTKFALGFYLQCYWQSESGSTDEKISYQVEVAKQLDRPVVMVMDGGRLLEAYNYANEKTDRQLRAVMNLTEFILFCEALAAGKSTVWPAVEKDFQSKFDFE